MRRSIRSAINPVFLFPLFLGKKVAAWAFLEAGSKYGWPRVYRRLLETTNVYIESPLQRSRVRALIKQSMIVPGKAYKLIFDSETMRFAERVVKNARHHESFREHEKFFDFFLPLLEALLKRTGIGRTMKLWESMSSRSGFK